VPPSVDSIEPAAGSGTRRAARAERVRESSITRDVANAIVEDTTDPANRYYRYPAARALLPILGRIPWLTPNHVTYTHILLGLAAAALVAFTHAAVWLLFAFVLCEARMILDCFDGVLARARGSSSPFGRALDEIADSIAFVALASAVTHRMALGGSGIALCSAALAFGGLCANAWDFYKRKISTALRDGKDGVLDELRHKRDLVESGRGTFLGYWGVYFDGFQVLLYDVRPMTGDAVALLRGKVNDRGFRRFVTLLSLLSFDNGLVILHVGILSGFFFHALAFTAGYAMLMWLATMVAARVVFRRPAA
jgi:hypothetical protein